MIVWIHWAFCLPKSIDVLVYLKGETQLISTGDRMRHSKIEKLGFLEVICGPMFSGKSEELIRRLRRAKIAKQRVAVFKHTVDDRYSLTSITSHNGSKLDAHAVADGQLILDTVKKEGYSVVGIDEIQFYPQDIIPTICTLIDRHLRVIVSGLDLDFRGAPFGPIPTLLAIADSITKFTAICTACGADAHFSQRLINNRPAKYNSPIVLGGGADKYVARCRGCYEIDKPFDYSCYRQIEK